MAARGVCLRQRRATPICVQLLPHPLEILRASIESHDRHLPLKSAEAELKGYVCGVRYYRDTEQ